MLEMKRKVERNDGSESLREINRKFKSGGTASGTPVDTCWCYVRRRTRTPDDWGQDTSFERSRSRFHFAGASRSVSRASRKEPVTSSWQ